MNILLVTATVDSTPEHTGAQQYIVFNWHRL